MKAVWKRIHTWLDANAPAGYGNLRPAASAEAIQAAEQAMGVKLPDDVKASYRIHDGQDNEPGLVGGEGWRLLSLEEMVKQWGRWSQANPNNAPFVPIAWIGTGDYVFLNLDSNSQAPGCLMIQRSDSADPDPMYRHSHCGLRTSRMNWRMASFCTPRRTKRLCSTTNLTWTDV